jgi:hypothetical protein
MLNRYTAVACSLDGWEAVLPWLLKFSCHTVHNGRINDGSVKALLPGRGDLLPLARVGSWLFACAFLALAGCQKNEPVDEAKAAGLTTADFPQITAGGSDHGRR